MPAVSEAVDRPHSCRCADVALRLVRLLHALDKPVLSRLHRCARTYDPDRFLRTNLSRTCRLSCDRRFHDRHSHGAREDAVYSGCSGRRRIGRHCRLPGRPAIAALSRCLSRDQHSGDALRYRLSGTTYQANFGASASAGITIADPVIGSLRLRGEHAWYYFLLALVTLFTVGCVNLVRTRPGRAWMAIRDRDIAAEALGINLTRYKLAAFMLSATLASVSGSLAAYYSNVVTVEGYTLDLAVIYVAMIIVGGMGSILGGLLGAIFITLLPYGIDSLFEFLPRAWRFGSTVFGMQVGAVGVCIILFLLFEPKGLAEIWRRTETYFDRWPFRYRPLDTTRR